MDSKFKTQSVKQEKILVVGKERINLRIASKKLIEDIQFLKKRINHIKQYSKPNKNTLQTYEEMLKSRESVLAWLEEQKGSECSQSLVQQG